MEEAKALAQQQQHLLLQHQQQQQQQQQQQAQHQHHQNQHQHHQHQHPQLQQQQQQQQHQQQHHQQFLLLQQLQKQAQQQQQQAAISRFPSNIDAHLRSPGPLHHRPVNQQQSPNPNPNPNLPLQNPNLPQQNPNLPQQSPNLPQQNPNLQQQNAQHSQQQQPQQQQKVIRPLNQVELQFAYQDAWRVCHPDFKRPFSSLEDACERLLPYHVVADYEAEEDDRILDSDTTGQMPSRFQQWDNNIAAKVAEFTATFEKQTLAFNIITRKRAMGEFRSEERLMIEQALLQEERKAIIELKAEIESREKAGREAHEAKLRMAALAHAEQARAESQAQVEMMAQAPIRASVLGSQGNNLPIGHDLGQREHTVNSDELTNGWGNNAQRDDKEPSDDFLNDDENENGDAGEQDQWREVGEFDLNTR